jgi:hypothetical protein
MIPHRLAVAFVLLIAANGSAQPPDVPERITALAVNPASIGMFGVGPAEVLITRWSTDAERRLFVERVRGERGRPDADFCASPIVGTLRTPTGSIEDLRYAYQSSGDEGTRQVIVATGEPIAFWDEVTGIIARDRPLTVVEFRLQPDGTGEGKTSSGAEIALDLDRGVIGLRSYESRPLALVLARSDRPSASASHDRPLVTVWPIDPAPGSPTPQFTSIVWPIFGPAADDEARARTPRSFHIGDLRLFRTDEGVLNVRFTLGGGRLPVFVPATGCPPGLERCAPGQELMTVRVEFPD